MLICVEKRYCDFHIRTYFKESRKCGLEWIECNGGYGITNYSEEPLESKQGIAWSQGTS